MDIGQKSRRKREGKGAVFEKGVYGGLDIDRAGRVCQRARARASYVYTQPPHAATWPVPRGQDGASRRYKSGEGEAGDAKEGVADRAARGRGTEGGSVSPEPTLNRRSMGHTLEENGKWGSWRGWPGKDGIPPHNLSLSFLFSFSPPSHPLVLSSLVLDALLQPHPPSSTCRPCCSSSSTIPLLPPISYFVLSPSSRYGRATSPH